MMIPAQRGDLVRIMWTVGKLNERFGVVMAAFEHGAFVRVILDDDVTRPFYYTFNLISVETHQFALFEPVDMTLCEWK
jgi:hypothetical protein